MNHTPTKRLGCGCCDGPEADRCTCHLHQDAPRGLLPHTCSYHADEVTDEHVNIPPPPRGWDKAEC